VTFATGSHWKHFALLDSVLGGRKLGRGLWPSHSPDLTSTAFAYPFNTGIKSLRATPPDKIFYWGFCFLNREFRKYMCEKPTNTPIIHAVY
jgi:hypothetical protein